MSKENQAELLPPENETVQDLPMLRIQTSLETLKNYFDEQAKGIARTIEWAKNAIIDSPKSRDEARDIRKNLAAFKKAIDEKRLLSKKPVEDFLTEYKEVCDAVIAIAEEGIQIIDAKGVAYAQECKRREDEEKAKALAAKKAEEDRILAERKKREAEEAERQAKEAEEVARKKKEAEAAAKKAGDNMTAKLQAEEAARAESAKVEAARAQREKEESDRQAAENAQLDQAQAQMVGEMAKATGHGKTKGVKNVWVVEVVDEKKVPREFCSYDPKKAKKYVEAGISQETDALLIIPGLRCYQVLTGSGR